MPTTPTETSVANAALVLLGERRISSLNDDTKTAKILKDRFPEVRDAFLRMHTWNFAVKRESLSADATGPEYEYTYAYTLPTDCLRVIELYNLGDLPYLIEGGRVITDLTAPLNIRYVAQITDMSAWDVMAREALAATLALDVAESFTGTASKVEQMAQLAQRRTLAAQGADGTEDPPYHDENSEWLNARFDGDTYAWWRVPSGEGTPL